MILDTIDKYFDKNLLESKILKYMYHQWSMAPSLEYEHKGWMDYTFALNLGNF